MRMTRPSSEFVWGVLRVPENRGGRRMTAQMRELCDHLFDTLLPCGIEGVHATYVVVDSSRVLACGLLHERVRAMLESDGGDIEVTSLGPDCVPSHVCDAIGEGDARYLPAAASICMLHGRYEGRASRARRSRAQTVRLGMVVLVMAGFILGFERRGQGAAARTNAADAAMARIYVEVFPTPSVQHPVLRLDSELRLLRSEQRMPTERMARDVGADLASVLMAWPRDSGGVWLESLRVSQDVVNASVFLSSQEDLQVFTSALEARSWHYGQPTLTQTRLGLRAQLRLSWIAASREHGRESGGESGGVNGKIARAGSGALDAESTR